MSDFPPQTLPVDESFEFEPPPFAESYRRPVPHSLGEEVQYVEFGRTSARRDSRPAIYKIARIPERGPYYYEPHAVRRAYSKHAVGIHKILKNSR